MDRFQGTINQPLQIVGTGLHSGRPVTLEILPTSANTGIVFQRSDIVGATPVRANARNISRSDLSTTIGTKENSISTVEHLMAAFVGVGIDNALVKLDGPEIPIMDGSAAPFVDRIMEIGVKRDHNHPRKVLVVTKSFEVVQGDKLIRVEPSARQHFTCEIDFRDQVIGKRSIDFMFSRSGVLGLCGARTFCNLREVNAMRAAGLALGGSLANAVVVTDTGVMNPEGLRSSDEFVRHKLLDCIGDLFLLGMPLLGKVTTVKSGHALHAKFMNDFLDVLSEHAVEMEVTSFSTHADERKAAMSEGLSQLSAAAAISL